MAKAIIQLETLTCPSCIKRIETSLRKTEGITSVKVLFNLSRVKAEFNQDEMNVNQIEEQINRLGYDVQSVKVSD